MYAPSVTVPDGAVIVPDNVRISVGTGEAGAPATRLMGPVVLDTGPEIVRGLLAVREIPPYAWIPEPTTVSAEVPP